MFTTSGLMMLVVLGSSLLTASDFFVDSSTLVSTCSHPSVVLFIEARGDGYEMRF